MLPWRAPLLGLRKLKGKKNVGKQVEKEVMEAKREVA